MKSRSIDPLARRVLDFSQAHALLPQGSRVLCALSGGTDSMALLTLLLELRETLDLTVCAAHFDHRLRGGASQADAAFTADWCEARGIPFRLGSGDVAGEARRLHQGIEETARRLRYAFLEESADALGADCIATAHHAGDNAETVLLHLLRGTGLDGLCGIPPRRGRLIRPLLPLTRTELDAYLSAHNIPHVEDASNADPRYTRNRLRAQVLPVLQDLNPNFLSRLTANLDYLQAERDLLDSMAAQLTQQARQDGDGLALPAQTLAQAPRPLALRALRQLFRALGQYQLSAVHLEAALALTAPDAKPSAALSLPGGLRAARRYGDLLLTRAPPPVPPAPLSIPGPGRWTFGPWVLELRKAPDAAGTGGNGWRFGPLDFPLTLRTRAPGDRLTLPGRPEKLLKKWYIDEKIPKHLRASLPVLTDQRGILAAGGLGPHAPRLSPGGDFLVTLTNKEERTEHQL